MYQCLELFMYGFHLLWFVGVSSFCPSFLLPLAVLATLEEDAWGGGGG